MTNGRDDLRDDAVERAWREHSREAPPAAIDDAIRAAARRAVGAKPQGKPAVAEAREPWRWWMPLAAAATIGAIAIGVIQSLPREAGEPTVVSDAATAAHHAAPATRAPASEQARPSVETVPARPAPAPEPRRADAPSERQAEPATAAPPAPSAPDRHFKMRAGADAADAPRDERETAAGFVASPPPAVAAAPVPAGAPSAAPGPAPAPSAQASAERAAAGRAKAMARAETAPAGAESTRDRVAATPAAAQGAAVKLPEAFVAEIRRLIAANDADGAARELRAFRLAYADADARLPPDLRPWAAGVPR